VGTVPDALAFWDAREEAENALARGGGVNGGRKHGVVALLIRFPDAVEESLISLYRPPKANAVVVLLELIPLRDFMAGGILASALLMKSFALKALFRTS